MTRPLVTFLSDFGWTVYSGICRGVIKRICPDADVVDITHTVPAYDIRAGALAWGDALPYLPQGVHLAVVDPGVGSGRQPIALRTARGDILVAPDNGLITLAADALGGVQTAVRIENQRLMLPAVSHTFHGRDLFAPVAAHLASGFPLADVGPAVDPETLIRLPLGNPRRDGRLLSGEVLHLDTYGSALLNLSDTLVAAAGWEAGTLLDVELGDGLRHVWPLVSTFADVAPGWPCILVDSSRRVCLAVNLGSAADRFGLRRDQPVRLAPADPGAAPTDPPLPEVEG